MSEEKTLFESMNGNIVKAFIEMSSQGKRIGRQFLVNSKASRLKRQSELAKLFNKKHLTKKEVIAFNALLEEWEEMFKRECFYHGIRCLMELNWYGKTAL